MSDFGLRKNAVSCSIRRVICLGAVLLTALLAAGCQSLNNSASAPQPSSQARNISKDAFTLGLENNPSWMSDVDTEQESDIWQRIRQGYKLQNYLDDNPRIDQQRLWFASRGKSIEIMSERSSPYMYYIVESLEARNMPLELALLPMIESAYDPLAYSRSHASGLWQFIPSTGRHFKLKQSHWYDARRDIMASTQAALDYLEYLNTMFNGDWLLALAAYNAGEGTVGRAIKRNIDRGLPTDYWNLNLPAETQAYVPKLLAVAQLINSPEAYNIALSPIADEPYFTQIPLKQQMDITRLAQLAKIKEDELLQLNPAYNQGITLDGPKHLLVPMESAELLSAKLAIMKPSEHVQWQQYTVRAGDNISNIANRHHVSIDLIKDINKLPNNHLRIGQRLSIPKSSRPSSNLAQATHSAPPRSTTYTVRAGDNLSKIAAQQKVTVAQLKLWNKLSSNSLKVGQNLVLNSSTANNQKTASRSRATFYKVRAGDSLYAIAKRHKISLKQLKNWNPKISSALKPGQTLSLYL
ncbi:MAG: LysM peptidoglycan-binding domain-containing protein [Gammaproteobacteria bacterium]|nr:LysM peptidoglycan-binding domain-containing protein [Gammaproteobacteria bacterium]